MRSFFVIAMMLVACCGCSDEASQTPSPTPQLDIVVQEPAFVIPPLDGDSQAEMAALADCNSEEVDLRLATPTPGELRELRMCPMVKSITIRSLEVTRQHLDALADKCPNLESLSVFKAHVIPDLLAPLSRLKSLRRLDIAVRGLDDAALEPLRGMPLTELRIGGTSVTDAGMRIVGTLADMEKLSAQELPLTDAGIEKLHTLSKLNSLNLAHTKVSDAGLKTIGKLTDLTFLGLNGTNITDAGLAELAPLTKMNWLNAECPQITDHSMEMIAGWPAVETLFLHHTNITDAGLETLSRAATLQNLHIGWTNVTDAGLAHLYRLPLQSLTLSNTATTLPAIAELKQANSEVKVYKLGRLQ